MTMTISVSGFDRTALLGPGMHAAAERALRIIGERMASGAVANAPVRTGFMRDHITPFELTGDLQGEFRSEAPYSGYVEYGTVHMAAEPFVRPAIDAERGTLGPVFEAALHSQWGG